MSSRSLEDRTTVARYPIQQTEIAPTKVVKKGKGHYFIDFGRASFGGLNLTLSSRESGRKVLVHMGEVLEAPHRVHRKPGGSIRYHRAEIVLKEGKYVYTVPLERRDGRRMPPSIGPVMPFRYAELENCPSGMTRNSVRQTAAHYPFNDGAARFDSSNYILNDVWEMCRYTMKATSFCGVYVDGDRERLPYEADAFINQLGHYSSDREFTLARYTHEYLMLNATWPTEWILHSVLMAWADYMHTGDPESLAEFYEDLKVKTLRSLAREDGLISTVQPPVSKSLLNAVYAPRMQDIVDWPVGERDGYEMRPVNTVVNAFHYRAMDLMARIAEALDRPEDARSFRSGADRVARSINQKLFDESTGLYLDGEGSRHRSLHANMFPLAFGIVPPELVGRVAEFLRRKGKSCSVYGAQYLLEALYEAGQGDYALSLLTARTDRSWAHMLYDVGSTMTLEAWDNRYKPNQDWNHAWGAAPANIIPRKLMGVEPMEPGFRKIRIRPQPGGLKWASMDLPTVRGTVRVSFNARPTRFDLKVRLPANTSAEVHLPLLGQESPEVMVDGVRRQGRVEDGFIVIESVGSGDHRISREGTGPEERTQDRRGG
ncbi:MAG: family 78 glycoside hydrolase catalytic domain [Armatimonadetes bacterium]|nr:family 78 glycoside hydrolase catalytic domain [Armatimonadota bacterium]